MESNLAIRQAGIALDVLKACEIDLEDNSNGSRKPSNGTVKVCRVYMFLLGPVAF